MNAPNSNSAPPEAVLETPSTDTAALPLSRPNNPAGQNRLHMNMDAAGEAEAPGSTDFVSRASAGDSFLSIDIGEEAAARIRDALSTAAHADPLGLSADHIHAFVEVNRLSSQTPATSEGARNSAVVIQGSNPQGIELSAYSVSELDYGGLNMPPSVEPTPDLPTPSSSIQRKRRAPPKSHSEPPSDPSSADEDERFDTTCTELLSSSILHDEIASRLASSGPVGECLWRQCNIAHTCKGWGPSYESHYTLALWIGMDSILRLESMYKCLLTRHCHSNCTMHEL